MQLFTNNKNDPKKKEKNTAKTSNEFIEGRISGFNVAIISNRRHLIDKVRSILFLYNVLTIEVILLSFDEIREDPRWGLFDVFIIDIDLHDDAERVAEAINRYIPIKATTILFGSHDSIIFSESLSQKGLHFLLENKQLENIPNLLYVRSITPPGSSKRTGSVVSFLGCKGGVGNSSLAVQVLKRISYSTNYPILYIQGASGSHNADFLLGVPVVQDGTFAQINDSLQVKIEQDDESWKYDYLDSGSFNITLLDQNMGISPSRKHLESIIDFSNIIFIVLNRDPYSIKIAKEILENINRMEQKNRLILNKRFLICVNDNCPVDKNTALQYADIEEYLGRPINFTRKYISNIDKFKKADDTPEIEAIAAALIGTEQEQKKRHSLFSLVNRNLFNHKNKKSKLYTE